MHYDPQAVMSQKGDAREGRDLKRWLRGASREERFAFISQCLEFRGYASEKRALDLAVACISEPEDARAILKKGFVDPDASSIKFWLEFGIAKLGGERVVHSVAALLESAPSTVDKALYWLPGLLPSGQTKAVTALRSLRAEAERRGIIRGPRRTMHADGSVTYSDVYPEDRRPC
jgi:hypothetical protein